MRAATSVPLAPICLTPARLPLGPAERSRLPPPRTLTFPSAGLERLVSGCVCSWPRPAGAGEPPAPVCRPGQLARRPPSRPARHISVVDSGSAADL